MASTVATVLLGQTLSTGSSNVINQVCFCGLKNHLNQDSLPFNCSNIEPQFSLALLNNLVIYWYAILATKTCWPNLISKIGLDERGIKDLSVAAVLPAVSVQQAAGQTK